MELYGKARQRAERMIFYCSRLWSILFTFIQLYSFLFCSFFCSESSIWAFLYFLCVGGNISPGIDLTTHQNNSCHPHYCFHHEAARAVLLTRLCGGTQTHDGKSTLQNTAHACTLANIAHKHGEVHTHTLHLFSPSTLCHHCRPLCKPTCDASDTHAQYTLYMCIVIDTYLVDLNG